MNLRDEFAIETMKTIAGTILCTTLVQNPTGVVAAIEGIAKVCYALADKMMEERDATNK
jgi:hypothetical protein